MTRIGQILVVLITCFALLFMGFAVTVFATRTNWRDKYNAEKTKKEELDVKRRALEAQITLLSDDLGREVLTHKRERDTNNNQLKDQKAGYDRLLADYKQAREDVVKAISQLKLAVDEATARREEAFRLRADLKTTQEAKEIAIKKQFETEQMNIGLKGDLETMTARAKDLEQRSAELVAILESHGLSPESKDKMEQRIKFPPPVEGIVLEVDPQGKLVQISVGKDDGLDKLHQLDVFRVTPKGKYVGRIEIIEVEPDRAVARILSGFKQDSIKKGDLVATRIIASR